MTDKPNDIKFDCVYQFWSSENSAICCELKIQDGCCWICKNDRHECADGRKRFAQHKHSIRNLQYK